MNQALSLDAWLQRIEAFHTQAIDLGLARSRIVYNRLLVAGLLAKPPLVVTFAGTNGKGSTLQFVENACRAAGLSVASYTSPHLFKFNERLRLNGVDVADEVFIQAFTTLEAYRQDTPLTYYEFTTLAAFIIMNQSFDVWLLEVGMGGRLDTVNLIDADIPVVTSIGLDHQQYLGDTREAIGFEKIHIARPDRRVYIGGDDVPASIAQYTSEHRLISLDYLSRKLSLRTQDWSLQLQEPQVYFESLPWPKIPVYNAALGLHVWFGVAEQLGLEPDCIDIQAIVASTQVFGRFTLWRSQPEIYLDAAHNPAAASLLAEFLQRLPQQKKTTAIVALMADKDVIGTLKPLLQLVDHWCLWPLGIPRALPAAELKKILQKLGVAPEAIEITSKPGFLTEQMRYIVYGSFYTLQEFAGASRF